jgi:hypothetical protein
MKFPALYWWRRLAEKRPPDFVIGGNRDPYLKRWFIIPRNRWFNIYLHHFLRSDDDRALHDHPWVNFSYILEGWYVEHGIAQGGVKQWNFYKAGDWKFRWPSTAHRVEVQGGVQCWTLFVTGPVVREWGFHCPAGWKHWKLFTKPGVKGEIGPGCGE